MRLSTLSCATILTAVCDPPGVLMIAQLFAEPSGFGEALVAADVVCVGAGIQDVAHGLARERELLDLSENPVGQRPGLRVHHDHAGRPDLHGDVAAAAREQVDVALHAQNLELSRCPGSSPG